MKLKQVQYIKNTKRRPELQVLNWVKCEIRDTLSARQNDNTRVGFLKTGNKPLLEMLSPLLQVHSPLSSTSQRIHALLHGGDITWTWWMESLQSHQPERTLSKLQTLERCSSQPNTPDPWPPEKIELWEVCGRLFGSHHTSSDSGKTERGTYTNCYLAVNFWSWLKVRPSDHSCHFLFVGPPAQDVLPKMRFWTFWWFWGWISAKLAWIWSKMHL